MSETIHAFELFSTLLVLPDNNLPPCVNKHFFYHAHIKSPVPLQCVIVANDLFTAL